MKRDYQELEKEIQQRGSYSLTGHHWSIKKRKDLGQTPASSGLS